METSLCFSGGLGRARTLPSTRGVSRVCARRGVVRASAVEDDGWGSWATYRNEMQENLEQRRAYAKEIADATKKSKAKTTKKKKLNTGNPTFDGKGIKFDFMSGVEGTSSSTWFDEKAEAYKKWESDKGYYKRTVYSFRDEVVYEDEEEEEETTEVGDWKTTIDYSVFGGPTPKKKKAPKKKQRKAKKKKIDICLYTVLGVPKQTDINALKKAYRDLARKYHPDRNPNNRAAAERMSEITFAYAVLKDPVSRDKYERGEI